MRYLTITAFLAISLLCAQAQTPVHKKSIDVCYGQPVTLTAASGTEWEWENGETTQSIEVLPEAIGDTVIRCNVVHVEVTVENNMMANGDYETVPDSWTLYNDRRPTFAGGHQPTNLGFESDYMYGGFDWPDGDYYITYPDRNTLYLITSNAQTHYWRDFAAITPHNGKYFAMFDGATKKGYAWKTNSDIVAALNDPKYPALEITQGTTYIFSYWSVYPERKTPAILQFTLKYRKEDGTMSDTIHLGAPNRLDSQPVGKWVQTSVTWVSPVNSDWVEIGVYDVATAGDGNDFGLDDICFQNYSELHKFVDDTYEYTIHVKQCAEPCEDFVYRKWNDVLFADNSAEQFVSYQWYADSVAIEGATLQFYQLTDTVNPHLYYVEATRTDGRVSTSCEQLFEKFTPSAQQHPASSNQRILHRGHLYIKTENAIYDILGNRVEIPLH